MTPRIPHPKWSPKAFILLVMCVSAAWTEDGTAVRPQAENVALRKVVLFSTPPNDQSSTDPDDALLIDGDVETGDEAPLQQAVLGKHGMSFTLHGEASRPRSRS